MDKQKKKELTSAWKERHPEMGVISILCAATGDEFLGISKDTSKGYNRHRFQLSANLHQNKELQELWSTYGEDRFEYKVLSALEYDDTEDVKTPDLEALLDLCFLEKPEAKRL